jgi:multidrug efflux pump subunit AcrA (membrane-fusion protein)
MNAEERRESGEVGLRLEERPAAPPPRRPSVVRWWLAALLIVATALGVGGYLVTRGGRPLQLRVGHATPPPEGGQDGIPVKAIRPRRDPHYQITVEQPAYVEAYFSADLEARVAGPISFLDVDIGDRVKAGQVLARIDVPDLAEDVLQKDSLVTQRQKELLLAQANVGIAQAAVDAAKAKYLVKVSAVKKAEADESFRGKELRRFQTLAQGSSPGITGDVLDERTKLYEAAVADTVEARAEVQKAQADVDEENYRLEAARADVQLKQAMVDVAAKDRDKAKANLSFATLLAPFDGEVARRNADPGSFVQNAATAHTEPILTLDRTDILTVYMKVPDVYAPYVTMDTEAVIEMGVLPGWEIQGKVTRFSRSLVTPEKDRTMRVEVDLFNGTAAEYQAFLAKAKANGAAGLKGHKLPIFPTVKGKAGAGVDGRLLPGMFGKMRLVLSSFRDTFLIPSSAVTSQGGVTYVYLVKNGRAVRTQVDVQVDNGKDAKVVLVEKVNGQLVRKPLTGDEVIVASNQGELSDGQPVRAPAPATDW